MYKSENRKMDSYDKLALVASQNSVQKYSHKGNMVKTFHAPGKTFYFMEISDWYMPDGLLGFTQGNNDINFRKNPEEYGVSKSEVKVHEMIHNRSDCNHEGNTPEHESKTRERVRLGVYPVKRYSFEMSVDYEKAA